MLTLQSRIHRSPDPLVADVNGELVMMDVGSGTYYNLDSIGRDIWERISRPIGVDELCRDLGAIYDADSEVILRDVLALLNQLQERGLISVG